MTPFDRSLLDELAAPAGVALSTVRLTVDLRRREAQLEELNRALAASSERLRDSRTEQQRRMGIEVERRVIPHLRAATSLLAEDVRPDPADVRHEASLALDELRALARGLHPPRLLDDGLIASLDGWIERRGRPVAVKGGPIEALPDTHLRVAYFCLLTLLDSLADAGSPDLTLTVSDSGDLLELLIAGRLPPSSASDDDLVQLARDRLEAFDGSLTSSRTADSVTFSVRLPRVPTTPELPRT